VISFFKKIFEAKKQVLPKIQFGRYTDHYKPRSKNIFWDQALNLHEKKDYIGSIKAFLDYLRDDEINNVTYTKEAGIIRFSIYQGSKIVKGFANQDSFFAEVKLAKSLKQDLGVYRLLLEENYMLQYCTFALDSEDNITLTMHSEYEDASPYKLYYGLKELAIRADKRDDIFIEKFDTLVAIHNGEIIELSEKEMQLKYDFYLSETKMTFDLIERDYDKLRNYPALITYIILSSTYSIDYLLKPEGGTMELIDKINDIGINQKFISPEVKVKELIKLFKKMTVRSKEDLAKELYETKSTFGTMNSGNYLRLREMVETDMQHYNWYFENGLGKYAQFIPLYISAYLLYSYAMPKPVKKYLELILRLYHNSFFTNLGFYSLINNKGIVKSEVLKLLTEIQIENKDSFTELDSNTIYQGLKYDSQDAFAASLLKNISLIDIKKKANATT
jgi:hypothetical protein